MHYFHLIGLSDVKGNEKYIEEILPDFSDRLTIAWQTVALGMVIVFAVLAILWFILEAFGKMAQKESSAESSNEPVNETQTQPDEQPPVEYEQEDESEIVAAITAAISLMLEAEGAAPKGFRVVSFKRADRSAHWNR